METTGSGLAGARSGPGKQAPPAMEPPDHGPPPPDLGFDGAGRGEDVVAAVAAPTSRVSEASMLW